MLQAHMPQELIVNRQELSAVGAAIHLIQAGVFVEIVDFGRRFAVAAAETLVADDLLRQRCRLHGELVCVQGMVDYDQISGMIGERWWSELAQTAPSQDRFQQAAIRFVKMAGFLPLCIVLPASQLPAQPAISVSVDAINAYPGQIAAALEIVADAQVPLQMTPNARFVAFRSSLGGPQHSAIVVGNPDPDQPVLCRLHSECFTGDIFGSMRCDCGEQLQGAVEKMNEAGGGVLLYLSQEGRGIGLVNKLRAYHLQDQGLDTVDANTRLGFEPDERNFACAAIMLQTLGFDKIRLLTNNPLKLQALADHGIEVAGRVEHSFKANDYNQFYLSTKARRSGHMIELEGSETGGAVEIRSRSN